MAEQTLKITLTADNSSALAGLREMVTSLEGVSAASSKTASSVSKSFAQVSADSKGAADRIAFPAEAMHRSRLEMVSDLDAIEKAFKQKWDGAGKAVEAVVPKIKTLQQQVAAFGGGVTKFNVPAYFGNIVQPVQAAGAALGKTASTVKQNTTTWMNLSRVVQDLPYGFNGIANNLTQLIPGVGAAGFAFSALVTAITFASVGFSAWTRKAKEAKEASDEFNKSLLSERQSAEESVSGMKALVDAATNVSLSNEKRLAAVNALRDQYPAYFKDLTNEQILTGNVTAATDSLTQAIYKRAEARAREADIAKKATKVFENQQKIDELNAKAEEARRNKLNASTTIVSTEGGVNISNAIVYGQIENKILKEKEELLLENSKLQIEIAGSQLKVNALTAASIGLTQSKTKSDEQEIDVLRELNKYIDENGRLVDKYSHDPLGIRRATEVPNDTEIRKLPTKLSPDNTLFNKEISQNADRAKQQLDAYNNALQDTENIMGILGPASDGFFDALVSGGNIVQGLGEVFKDLAAQIAKAAIKAAIFQAIFAAVSGGTSTVAGSGGFLGSFRKLLGFADGGVATGPKSGYPVMLHGTEAIFNGGQLTNLVNNVSARTRASMGGMQSGTGLSAELGQLREAVNNLANQPVQVIPFMKGADWNLSVGRVQQQTLRNY